GDAGEEDPLLDRVSEARRLHLVHPPGHHVAHDRSLLMSRCEPHRPGKSVEERYGSTATRPKANFVSRDFRFSLLCRVPYRRACDAARSVGGSCGRRRGAFGSSARCGARGCTASTPTSARSAESCIPPWWRWSRSS